MIRLENVHQKSDLKVCLCVSSQSSDPTQIEDSQLHQSPVFPLTGCRAEVRIGRLSQDLLDTCRSSGFVLCSQNGSNATQKSPRPESPTFPESNVASCPKSPALSGTDPDNSDEIEPSPECAKSPVFGRNAQHERSLSARRPQDAVRGQDGENSGFTFSSQDSFTPSARPTSPVFPQSPGILPSERLAFPKSPVRGQTEPSHAHSESPVFGLQQQRCESPPASRKVSSEVTVQGQSAFTQKAERSLHLRRFSESVTMRRSIVCLTDPHWPLSYLMFM